MERLPKQIDILGDDLPYVTQIYRKVPNGFRFDNLVFPTDKPLTLAVKDKLIDFANRYYRNHEIVGKTYVDFFESLQVSLDLNVDNFEKLLEVYEDDIAKPTQSRTIKRTTDLTDTDNSTGNTTTSDTTDTTGTSKDFDLPVDNGGAQETARTDNTGSTESSGTINSTNQGTTTHKGTETEEWSDVGVAPNYELLNGFLDNNRSMYEVFVSYFENDFTIMEVMTW